MTPENTSKPKTPEVVEVTPEPQVPRFYPITDTKKFGAMTVDTSGNNHGTYVRLQKPHGDGLWHKIGAENYTVPVHLGNSWYWFTNYWAGTEDLRTDRPVKLSTDYPTS